GLYFILGYILHIVGDSFSKSGVKWLVPFSEKSFQSGMGVVWYRTGSKIENLIFLGSVLILIMYIKVLDFNTLHLPSVNITHNLSEAINHIKTLIKH
ncbi:metal-dependent hydrolase, partial [Streptomyces koyangensis]